MKKLTPGRYPAQKICPKNGIFFSKIQISKYNLNKMSKTLKTTKNLTKKKTKKVGINE